MSATEHEYSFFDSHVHLNSPRFSQDVDQVWGRAKEVGVRAAVVVGYDLLSSRRAIELARQTTGLFAAVGIHPHSSDESTKEAMGELARLAEDPVVVAIGETGLDFYRGLQSSDTQGRSFEAHLRLAFDCGLPAIIHIRDAFAEALQCLQHYRGPGVIHCYTGGPSQLAGFLERGLYISFSGVVTYASGQMVRQAAKVVPIEQILVETDCPYLSPMPSRAKRNEPSRLIQVVDQIAQIRGQTRHDIGQLTYANAARLFQVGQGS